MNRTGHIYIALLVAVLAVGCNIETTPSEAEDTDADADEQLSSVDLGDGFHLEPYGISADWYDYDSTTHAITPRSLIYRVSGGDLDVSFRVVSYYDDRGTSGYFTLKVRGADDAQPTELVLGANAKDAPVCVDMSDFREVDCAASTHHLVFRADLRVVPAAGFAVQNPSIYTNSHFTSDAPLTIYQARGDSLAELPEDWTRLPDAKASKADQLLIGTFSGLAIDALSDVFVQATADMMLAGWSIAAQTEDLTSLRIRANCQTLEASSDVQTPPDLGASEEATIQINQPLTYVDLCAATGPQVVEASATPPRGLWSSSDSYDLIVENFGGEVSLRLAPGHLIWSSDQSSELDGAVDVPSSLWD